MASFFAGASNVTINGGEFNDIKGNYTIFDNSRHNTNIDSNNTTNNTIRDSYNDNSTTIIGRNPPNHEEYYKRRPTPSTPAGNQPPPPPQQHFSSTGGHINNVDSFNVKNTNYNDVFNNYSQNHYNGPMPPNNSRQRGWPPTMPGEDQEMHNGDPQSNSASPKRGQFQAPGQGPYQAGFLSQMGVRPGPHMSMNNPNIQQMGPEMQMHFEQIMKHATAQTQARVPSNGGQNHQSNAPNKAGLPDSMNTGMANLSMNDRVPSGDSSNSQPTTHLFPPPTFSRNKSDPQIASIDPMGSSALTPYNNALHHSHSNPSMAPHLQEPAVANFLPQPVPNQEFHGNDSQPSSTYPFNLPTGGPKFNTIYGDVTKHDDTVHNTNMNSFNTKNNTIKDSFNDNSFHSSVTQNKAPKKREYSEPDTSAETRKKTNNGLTPSSNPDERPEEALEEEEVGQNNGTSSPVPSTVESAVSGKESGNKSKKWFFGRKSRGS